MWRKVLELFIKRPDLLMNHVEAYATQASLELQQRKLRYVRGAAWLVASLLGLFFSLCLLAFAGVLDLALSINNRTWVYVIPGAAALVSAWGVWRNASVFKRSAPSALAQQLREDFGLIKSMAQAR